MKKPKGFLRNAKARREQLAQEVQRNYEIEREYQRRIRELPEHEVRYWKGEQDPDARSSDRLDHSISWRQRAYASAVLGEEVTDLPPLEQPNKKDSHPLDRLQGMDHDRRYNFLYYKWKLYQAAQNPDQLDFEPWNELVATRAALIFLAYSPPSIRELLKDLYKPEEYETIPDPESARRFLEEYPPYQFEDTGRGAEEFLALAYQHVPGIKRAAFRLLSSYRRVVRNTWSLKGKPQNVGHLPGDDVPPEPEIVTWDQIMRAVGKANDPYVTPESDDPELDRAVMLYLGGMSIKEAAKQTGIGDKRLSQELREREIPVRRGRPKRK